MGEEERERERERELVSERERDVLKEKKGRSANMPDGFLVYAHILSIPSKVAKGNDVIAHCTKKTLCQIEKKIE